MATQTPMKSKQDQTVEDKIRQLGSFTPTHRM